MHAETELGRPLPCQANHTCPYAAKWDFDPDEYEALIGHYSHAYKPKVTQGRAVVFDEFPGDTYETQLDTALPGAVTAYLQATPELAFEDYTDLVEHRDDEQRRADALTWFREHDVERDGLQVFDDAAGHAAAPLAVFTLLARVGDDLGNGWERADLGEHGIGLHDREQGAVYVLSPPPLEYTRSIVALDGTPTPALWERALGVRLNHRTVLTEAERVEYVRDVLELNLMRTTEHVKSYAPKESHVRKRVGLREDAALLAAIAEQHGQKPALIGAVIGPRNFGPAYVKKWAAYLEEEVDPTILSPENDFQPADYGPVGNEVRTHMREHETLQAAMRFGRDGNGATVYVHTNTLPDSVPIAGEGRVKTAWSDGMREVLEATADREAWTTAEVAAEVSITERQVRVHLHRLVDDDAVDIEHEGRGYVWRDTGLHRVNDHGEVELVPVDLKDLADEEVAEVDRSSIYTWDFRNSAAEEGDSTRSDGTSDRSAVTAASKPGRAVSNGGDRPPDGVD